VAQTPDVRVRLSAEGVDEVVNAMRRVQAEAKKTDGVKALQGAFSDLKSTLIGGLGIAAAVESLAELGKKSFENIVNIGLLSEKIGTSTEMLSVLSLAAKDVGVSQEQLGNGLIKLAKAQDQASQGSTKQVDAFKRLGISMQDVKSKDPGQLFVQIADRMGTFEGGAKKAAIAQVLFGKSGSDLIPVLNELANGGFQKVADKAHRMGLAMSQDVVDGAKRAHKALIDLGNIAEGVATQFLSGFAPAAADAMEQFGNAVAGEGGESAIGGMKKLGEYLGFLAKLIVAVFVSAGQIIGSYIGGIVEGVKHGIDQIKILGGGAITAISQYAQGDVVGAAATIVNTASLSKQRGAVGFDTAKSILTNLGGQLSKNFSNLTTSSDPIGHKPKAGGGTGDGNLTAIAKARLEFLKAQADNELAIMRTTNQLEGQENDRVYRDGLVSLQDYYDKRADLIDAETDAEIKNLQTKRDLIKKAPADDEAAQIKKQQELDAINAQITQKILERDGKIAANEDARFNAKKEHNLQEIELQEKIATAEGDRDQAAKLALDAEILKTEELLQKQGVAAEKIKEILDAVRSAGQGRVNFDISSQQGSRANNDLDLAKREIQRQADTGQINGLQAEAQILALEKDRITTLRAIGKSLTDNAAKSKDPALIQQAKDFNAAVDDIEASTNRVGIALAQMKNELAGEAKQAFTTFFVDASTGAKSFSQAFSDMAKSFEQSIAKMIAQLIELYLEMLLVHLLTPNATEDTGGGAVDMTGGLPGVSAFDSGGYTGDGGKFQPAGIVHRGEFVSDQETTRRYRPLLEMMHSGSMRGIRSSGGGSYAGGGYVGGGGAPVQVNIDTQGQPASQTQRQGPDGRAIIDVVIGQVAADIASGGKVHRAIENTYGVRRAGVKRV
jgi:hypothetical protein